MSNPEEERVLFISATSLSVVQAPDGAREVAILLDIPKDQIGLAPGLSLALRMSSQEAREFAASLRRKADEAEGEQLSH